MGPFKNMEGTIVSVVTRDGAEAFWSFAKRLLDEAFRDSPAEIHEWCSSELCKELCIHFNYDRNEYRINMMKKCLALRKTAPLVAYAGPKADPADAVLGPLFSVGA